MTRALYVTADEIEMIEVAPHQFVNAVAALAFGLVSEFDLSRARAVPAA